MASLSTHIESKLNGMRVPLALGLPSGQWVGPADAQVRLKLRDSRDLAALITGRVGALGTAIVEGRVAIEGTMRELMGVVLGLLRETEVGGSPPWWSRGIAHVASHLRHSRIRDADQIAFHYDVSDDFYALWLDPRRVYSCAYFATPDASLAAAQEAKLDLICRKLDLKPGERFLDIGAGWGGLLFWAAEHYGVVAQGITLSRNQHAYVNGLIAAKGLGNRVRMDLVDYRDLDPRAPFDKIASVGMIEHVGYANMATYFGRLRALARPGGMILNHGITTGGLDGAQIGGGLGDFIERYIFPGGELRHVSEILRKAAMARLEAVDVESLRPHYARTLWAWSDALEARLAEAAGILERHAPAGEAAKILRAYRLYLAGCATSFEQGWVSLYQLLLTRPTGDVNGGALPGAQSDYPFRRDYIYH